MQNKLRSIFQRFLTTQGYCTPPGRAACALRSARTLIEWQEAESAGLVRLRIEPERESYFDVYGKPDDAKELAQIEAALQRDGCWHVLSEVNHGTETSGDKWQVADSIGMCVYNDPLSPFDNDYVPQLMSAALAQIEVSGEH